MNPDFQFVRDPAVTHAFSDTGTKCHITQIYLLKMKWKSIFPIRACGSRCSVASTQYYICLDVVPFGQLSCKIFHIDVVTRHCCKSTVPLTLWQWWATLNELPASRQSEQQRQPAPGPCPPGPWAYISVATAHITNTASTVMWQLNPSPTSPT